jgi:ribulose-bisphosphate carboxylase small chain
VRITQGCFSFLPDLSNDQIKKQIEYAVNKGWAISIEWTDDPHPRNTYWELWGLPLFDIKDASAIIYEITECRRINPEGYIKINAFDSTIGTESCVMSFIIQRPKDEPGFYLERTEVAGRQLVYTIKSYATQAKPEGSRY